MGRTPSASGGLTGLSIRLEPSQLAWIAREIKKALTTNGLIRQLIDDAMNLFGLPAPVLEVLREDAKSKGINFDSFQERRDYLVRLLMLRYDALVRGETMPLGKNLLPKSKIDKQ